MALNLYISVDPAQRGCVKKHKHLVPELLKGIKIKAGRCTSSENAGKDIKSRIISTEKK